MIGQSAGHPTSGSTKAMLSGRQLGSSNGDHVPRSNCLLTPTERRTHAMRHRLLGALVSLIVLNCPSVLLGQEDKARIGPMSHESLEILREAVIAVTPDQDEVRAEDL